MSALGGGLGILAAIGLTSVIDVDDARLSHLMPYFAAAMALIGMVEVLGHHRIGAGFPETFAAVAAAAVALGVLLLVGAPTGVVDTAVTAAAVSSGVAAVGLHASPLASLLRLLSLVRPGRPPGADDDPPSRTSTQPHATPTRAPP